MKTKLNTIEVLISKPLISGSEISHDEFVLMNNVLKKFTKKNIRINVEEAIYRNSWYCKNSVVEWEKYKRKVTS